MKKAATIILRITLAVFALAMLGVCFGVGLVVFFDGGFGAGYEYMGYLLFGGAYAAAVPFFITLFQSAKLLGLIDKGLAFSEKSVKALTIIIKSTLAIFAVGMFAGLPFFYMFAELDDAPGVIIVGLFIVGAIFSVAVFAYVLRWLLKEAISFKERASI